MRLRIAARRVLGLIAVACAVGSWPVPAAAQTRVSVDGVSTLDNVATVDTGQGANELYPMDQAVRTTDGVTFTGVTSQQNNIGAVETAGLFLENTEAAATGAQQSSPSIDWCGNGWKTTATAASQSVCLRQYMLPVQGTTAPTGLFLWRYAINGAAYATSWSLSIPSGTLSGPLVSVTAGYYLNGVETIALGTPVVSSCGDGVLATGSKDSVGRVNASNATACTVTFSNALGTNGASCIVENLTSNRGNVSAASTTAFTVSNLTAGDDFTYICFGY